MGERKKINAGIRESRSRARYFFKPRAISKIQETIEDMVREWLMDKGVEDLRRVPVKDISENIFNEAFEDIDGLLRKYTKGFL